MSIRATMLICEASVGAFSQVLIANSVQNSRLLSASQYIISVHCFSDDSVTGPAMAPMGTATANAVSRQNRTCVLPSFIPDSPQTLLTPVSNGYLIRISHTDRQRN